MEVELPVAIGVDEIEDRAGEMLTDKAKTHFFQENLHVLHGDLPVAVLVQ